MRIIDEKGSIFGKINALDFLVILLLVCIVPAFYFGGKILSQPKIEKLEFNLVPVDVYAIFKDLNPEVAKLISPGDKDIYNFVNSNAEILDVINVESNFIELNLGRGQRITLEEPHRKQVTVKMRVVGTLQGDTVLFKGAEIRIGSAINFKTNQYEAEVLIIPGRKKMMADTRLGLSAVNIDLKFKNLSPEVANLVLEGDFETDAQGNIVAKTLSVGSLEPYNYKVELADGSYVTQTDFQKVQLLGKLEIVARVEGDAFYFRDKRIAVGSEIEFNTNKYSIVGEVIRPPVSMEKIPLKLPIHLDLKFKNLSPEVGNLISVGDVELGEDEDVIAKVLNLGELEPYHYTVNLDGRQYISRTDPEKRQVLAKMEVMGNVEGDAFYFRDKRIAIASEIEFNTNKYQISGIVETEPVWVKKIDKKYAVLKIKFTNVMPELAALINAGDEEREFSGEWIAKIVSVLNKEPTRNMFLLEKEGVIKLVPYSVNQNQDVIILLMARCLQTNKGLLFKDTRIKVGNNLSFQSDEYDVKGIIIGIEEIEDIEDM